MKGRILVTAQECKRLSGNRAGEPSERIVTVYLPPEASDSSRRFPVLYALAPWTHAGRSMFEWKPFKESLPERLERLTSDGKMPPAIVVAPDLYTQFGGSQYINSSYFGPHGDYIVHDLIPYVEQTYPVQVGPAHRGVFGRSSGGFGAIRLATDYPGAFAAVASHSGDMGFDLLFHPDLHTFCEKLAKWRGGVSEFLAYVAAAPKLSNGDIHLLMLLGSAGFYSPNPHTADGFDIPIDLYSGEIVEQVWRRWLEQDPVIVAATKPQGLRSLRHFYLECGRMDQYRLLYGARQLHQVLRRLGIEHDYEEFDDNHSGTEYRFDISLPRMMGVLSEDARSC